MTYSILKFIDLFCGIGGFHQAASIYNWECILASDIDKECRNVYKNNYDIEPLGDIKNINEQDIPDFDILFAGFPCQAFSHSGKQLGFQDQTRGTLFFDICRILNHKTPKFFILENVKNLFTHDKGNTWKTIYNSIIELGYNTYEKPIVVSPLFFGIPQNRDRLFIVGIRKDQKELPPYPTFTKLSTNINDILDDESDNDKTLHLNKQDIITLNIWEEFIQYFKNLNIKLPTFPIWTEEMDLDYDISQLPSWKQTILQKNRLFYHTYSDFLDKWLDKIRHKSIIVSKRKLEWQSGVFQENDSIWSLIFQFRPSGIRVSRTNYSPALVAMAQIVYIGSRKRKLSPREVSRLQSFPDSFKINSNKNTAYKQFGNAVNVRVAQEMIKHLLELS